MIGDHPRLPDYEPFRCEVEPERDAVRLRLHGELDLASAPQVEERVAELREAGFRRVVVDLGGLSFVDSSGVRLLMSLAAEARSDGFVLAIAPGPPGVQRVFAVAGVLEWLPFVVR